MKSGLTGIMISIVVYLAAMVYVGWYFSKKGSGDSSDEFYHGCVVVKAEQTVKKSSDCLKAGCGIGNKENQDNDGRNAHQNIFLIPIPAGEELGYGDSVADNGIPAQPFCNNQPV